MKKLKITLDITAALLFWPPLIYLGFKYGWQLPVALFVIVLAVLMQLIIKKQF